MMLTLSRCSLFALAALLVSSASSAQVNVAPLPEAACPIDDAAPAANSTPMCRYLEKCCAGGTDKAGQCCAAYLKRCG